MKPETLQILKESVPNQARANQLLGRLFEVAQPAAVFSEPTAHGDHVVITASEVTVALGAGYGGGGGQGSGPGREVPDASAEGGNVGYGGGGGGGGTSTVRPVAVISIGPHGVQVEPIVDVTKMALALLTAVGAMFLSLGRMRRLAKRAG